MPGNDHGWDAVGYALEPLILHGIKNKVEEEEVEEFPGARNHGSSWMA
jgi:hypothetical protein